MANRPSPGRMITTAVMGTWPVLLHPLRGGEWGHNIVRSYVNRALFQQVNDDVICVFCVSAPSEKNYTLRSEKTSDGHDVTVATYEIRPDARWGDGEPITSADLVFSFEVMDVNRDKIFINNTKMDSIIKITQITDKKFSIIQRGVICSDRLAMPPLIPSHLEKEIWDKSHNNYFDNSLYIRQPNNPGLYNGPFLVLGIDEGLLHLKRNNFWIGRKPYFERVDVYAPRDQDGLNQIVRSKRVDNFTTLMFSMGQNIVRDFKDIYNPYYAPSDYLVHLKVNFNNIILSDVRVRKALLLGIDRDGLLDKILDGKGIVAQGLLNPFMPGYVAVSRYPYSTKKAEQWLDESGWLRGNDGLRYNAAGEPLKFELRYRRYYPWVDLAPSLAAAWRKLGITVNLVEDPDLSGDALDSRQRYTGLVGFAQNFDQDWDTVRLWYHSSMIPRQGNGWQGSNHFGIDSPDLDRALDKLATARCSRDLRQAAMADIQRAYADGLPTLPIWFGTVLTLSDKRLSDTVDAQTFSAAPIENWRLRD